jgi:hypothetical protein
MNPTQIARSHQAAVVLRDVSPKTRVEYSDSGRISAVELAKMLEPDRGLLTELHFRRSLKIDPNGIEWEALDERAHVVSGKLILHAAVSENEIVSWAEVVIDEDRDASAAVRVAIRYMRDSGGLVALDEEGDDGPVDDEGQRGH